jgi:ADP-ribose pyrophosphatase YjhB (NUDIX family)
MNDIRPTLYLIADEMRGMASMGKHFAHNVYEVERAHRIMELAVQVAALADGSPQEEIRAIFEQEPWRRFSPALGAEAVVLNPQGEILLIQRRDNQRWAMPGGVAEIGQTAAEAVLRELWEEAGLRGRVKQLVAIFDGRHWGTQSKVHIWHLVFRIDCDDLTPQPGTEALDAQFFARDHLPAALHEGHGQRIAMVFEVLDGPTYFDPASSIEGPLPMFQQTSP